MGVNEMKILVTVLLVTALLSLTLGGLVYSNPTYFSGTLPSYCGGSWDVDSSGPPPVTYGQALWCQHLFSWYN